MRKDWSKSAREREAARRRRRGVAFLLALAVVLVAAVCARSLGSPSAAETSSGPPSSAGAGREAVSPAAALVGTTLKSASAGAEAASSAAELAQLSDPLLVLVNDQSPLPDDWEVELVSVNDEEQIDARAYQAFTAMCKAAGEEEIWFWVASGYRSVEQQETILERGVQRRMNESGMSREEAEEDALRTIARPGCSEHHTGLALDLNNVSDDFESTAEYQWLSQYAAEYGFVQRYRKDKVEFTGIDNESWHYRYVGREHAQEMERLDMCLEEYVAWLKEQSQR